VANTSVDYKRGFNDGISTGKTLLTHEGQGFVSVLRVDNSGSIEVVSAVGVNRFSAMAREAEIRGADKKRQEGLNANGD